MLGTLSSGILGGAIIGSLYELPENLAPLTPEMIAHNKAHNPFQGGAASPLAQAWSESQVISAQLRIAKLIERQHGVPTELYKLVARSDGWYPIEERASNQTQNVWLNEGDVWKYGISVNSSDRYKQSFLTLFNLDYVPLMTLDSRDVANAIEKALILVYPLKPENINRPICQLPYKKSH